MLRPRAAGLAAVLVALLPSAGPGAAPRERATTNTELGIRVEAPPGWELTTHGGYAGIVAVLLHPDGSRLSVAAGPTTAANVRELVEQSRGGLEAQRIRVQRVATALREGWIEIEARAPDGEVLRQAYLHRPWKGRAGERVLQSVAVTLTTKPAALATHARAFDTVLRRLELQSPAEGEPPDGGADAR